MSESIDWVEKKIVGDFKRSFLLLTCFMVPFLFPPIKDHAIKVWSCGSILIGLIWISLFF